MANIGTYLARILSAVYGEEVRSAIHDAISAMNDESSQAMADASTAQDSAAASALAAGASAVAAEGSKSAAVVAASAAGASASASSSSAAAAASSASSAAGSASSAQGAKTASELAAASAVAAKNEVDDKVAVVVALKSDLMSGHAVYQELTDNSGEALLDSGGNELIGRILFADAGDILSLSRRIDALQAGIAYFASLFIAQRLGTVESNLDNLNEHALLDSAL